MSKAGRRRRRRAKRQQKQRLLRRQLKHEQAYKSRCQNRRQAEYQMYAELCPQHLKGIHRQRAHYPEILPLHRH